MHQRTPWQDPSRRAFLGGAAGIAAAAMLPWPHSTQATAKPLTGATVRPESYGLANALTAARIADGFIGLPLATTLQKLYRTEGELGVRPNAEMIQLASVGCHFLLSLRPSQKLSGSEQTLLKAYLTALNRAGLRYRVALWAEMDDVGQFPSRQEWLAYWRYYAPVVKAAGVRCVYDAGCNKRALPRAEAWFPSHPAPDELWIDYYATAFQSGARIDKLLAQARAAGVHAGLAEWGWAGNLLSNNMTMHTWDAYCKYLIHLAQGGNFKLGAIYYGSEQKGIRTDVIKSARDPRIAMIRSVSNAVRTA